MNHIGGENTHLSIIRNKTINQPSKQAENEEKATQEGLFFIE